jgi:hypothetical protein
MWIFTHISDVAMDQTPYTMPDVSMHRCPSNSKTFHDQPQKSINRLQLAWKRIIEFLVVLALLMEPSFLLLHGHLDGNSLISVVEKKDSNCVLLLSVMTTSIHGTISLGSQAVHMTTEFSNNL